mmetsp:Transcript_16436/g.23868  ORF Transcript_16436/g.23868 Transcript_16436/m.23868 type:complete len:220 (-) Transcript_16436:833-1492(-)
MALPLPSDPCTASDIGIMESIERILLMYSMAFKPDTNLARSTLFNNPRCVPSELMAEPRVSSACFIPSATSSISVPLAVVARAKTITNRILSSTLPFAGSVTSSITWLFALPGSFLKVPVAILFSNSKNCGTSREATSFITACRIDVCTSNCFLRSNNAGRESTAVANSEAPLFATGLGAMVVVSPALLRISCSLRVTSCSSTPFCSIASGKGLNLWVA